MSCGSTSFTASMGMAKPMPLPLGLMAVLMPTTCPRRLKSGPPLLPGLMLASVWMKSSYGPAPMVRPLALTMPIVTVWPRPNGLPMATTYSPTRERIARAERRGGQVPGRVLQLEHGDVEARCPCR